MMANVSKEILDVVREKGLLLDSEVFKALGEFSDSSDAKLFLEYFKEVSGEKCITKNNIGKNIEFVKSLPGKLSEDGREIVDKIFVKFGINVEVRKEREVVDGVNKGIGDGMKVVDGVNKGIGDGMKYQVFYANTNVDKKIEMKDFVGNFRSRYSVMQEILMGRANLQDLISIGKIGNDRRSFSFIGMVNEKRVTKNRNLIITFEDLTGKIGCLVKEDNKEVFAQAQDLQLDDIVGVRASGNREIAFIHDIVFPDSFVSEKVKFDEDCWIGFLSDFHTGSDRHLKKSVGKMLDWLNTDDEIASKIKYLFFNGDNVDGVGIFPSQESVLELKSMREQYLALVEYLKRVPSRISMFMCPGQHDATRVAEPQPLISQKYAPELYDIENLTLVTNPTLVKLLEGEKEFKILMYHGAAINALINNIIELRMQNATEHPAKAVKHMLKRRHLSPTHSIATYIPNADEDGLMIREVPNIFVTGEVHRIDIDNYNGVLIITNSCWQAQTPFEEMVGHIPDPGKMVLFNLKTHEIKILDFLDEEEVKKWKI